MNGTTVLMSRMIMNRMNIDITDKIVLHKNKDTLDLRRSNLYVTTRAVRQKTRAMQSNNTSGTTGVWYNPVLKGKKWVAFIQKDHKRIYSYFDSEMKQRDGDLKQKLIYSKVY